MGAFVIRRTACGHGVRTGKISVSVVSFFLCVCVCRKAASLCSACVTRKRLFVTLVTDCSALLSHPGTITGLCKPLQLIFCEYFD